MTRTECHRTIQIRRIGSWWRKYIVETRAHKVCRLILFTQHHSQLTSSSSLFFILESLDPYPNLSNWLNSSFDNSQGPKSPVQSRCLLLFSANAWIFFHIMFQLMKKNTLCLSKKMTYTFCKKASMEWLPPWVKIHNPVDINMSVWITKNWWWALAIDIFFQQHFPSWICCCSQKEEVNWE